MYSCWESRVIEGLDLGSEVEANGGIYLGTKLTIVATVVGRRSDIISEHQPARNSLHVEVTNGQVLSIALEVSVRKVAPKLGSYVILVIVTVVGSEPWQP